MKRYASRHAAVSLLLVAMLALTGCSQGTGARTDVTLDGAKTTITDQMETLIGRIDPASIERIDDVTNDSFGCRDHGDDPDQRVRQWEIVQVVWLIEGVGKLDVFEEMLSSRIDEGWTVASDVAVDGDGRRVRLHDPVPGSSEERPGYLLTLGVGPEDNGQRAITVSTDSPCFEVTEEAPT
jgi:hypothetical protein